MALWLVRGLSAASAVLLCWQGCAWNVRLFCGTLPGRCQSCCPQGILWWFFAAYERHMGYAHKAAGVLLRPWFLHYRFWWLSLCFLFSSPLSQLQTARHTHLHNGGSLFCAQLMQKTLASTHYRLDVLWPPNNYGCCQQFFFCFPFITIQLMDFFHYRTSRR